MSKIYKFPKRPRKAKFKQLKYRDSAEIGSIQEKLIDTNLSKNSTDISSLPSGIFCNINLVISTLKSNNYGHFSA